MQAFRTTDKLNGETGRVLRPVMLAMLTVPVIGSAAERKGQARSEQVITLQVAPKHIRIERNDHNTADTCSITLDWTTAGVDARLLDDATVEAHIGTADENGYWFPTEESLRFCGIVKEVDSERPGDEAAEVTLNCLDYTDIFLKAKPFGSSGVPKLSQTIREAWQTVVSQTPGAEIFASRLVLQDVDPNLVIGKGVSERFRKLAYVQTKPDTDAWTVWMTTVGMLGLISYIDKDQCVVTTATNYYTERDAPKMVWGHNILRWHENRDSAQSKKGVWLTSFDPETRQVIEAAWPPIGDASIKRKRATAKKKLSEDQIRQREERDYFSYYGVQSVDMLTEIAKRVYEERSRQELEGDIATPLMFVETERAKVFDLLDLRAGENLRVEVEPHQKQLLGAMATDAERYEYLEERGYSEGARQLIVANVKNLAELDARFLTKSVSIDCEVDDDGGNFEIEVDYVNRINIDGSANS